MTHHVTQPLVCPECKGSGDCPEHTWRPCPICYGNGVIYVNRPPEPREPVDEPPGYDLPPAA